MLPALTPGLTNDPALANEDDERKPNHFRILLDRDTKTCQTVQRAANEEGVDRKAPSLERLRSAVDWTVIDGSKDFAHGDLAYSVFDLDGDGVDEWVFKTRSSIRGVMNEKLHVFPSTEGKLLLESGITARNLYDNGWQIEFGGPTENWLPRARQLYGSNWQKYVYSAGASNIKVIAASSGLALVAWNPYMRGRTDHRIAVVAAKQPNEFVDLCLVAQVCPCRGCADPPRGSIPELDPAAKWRGTQTKK